MWAGFGTDATFHPANVSAGRTLIASFSAALADPRPRAILAGPGNL